jgi:hypothetical protein
MARDQLPRISASLLCRDGYRRTTQPSCPPPAARPNHYQAVDRVTLLFFAAHLSKLRTEALRIMHPVHNPSRRRNFIRTLPGH